MVKSRVPEGHLATPHFVEWAVSWESDPDDWEYEEFASRADAVSFAHEKDVKRYVVLLGEVGVYPTDRGNLIQDWIYYWWNEKAGWPLQIRERGDGRPWHAWSRSVSYTPFDKTDWKGQ